MHRAAFLRGLPLVVAALAVAAPASAKRTLSDFRYFRALSIDLNGRIPTRDEVAAYEKDDFNVDEWIDAQLHGRAYTERVRRVYMDLLRLEIPSSVNLQNQWSGLRRLEILGPDGDKMWVYYRTGQRRKRDATDGAFCLTKAETGFAHTPNRPIVGTPKPVSQEALDANTTVVRPWWLYSDYKSDNPSHRYGDVWKAPSTFVPNPDIIMAADKTPVTEVRICNEEAQTGDMGTVFVTGRKGLPKGTPIPYERLIGMPLDSGYAKAHAGEPVSCNSTTAIANTTECGCGPGLERCLPGNNSGNDPGTFVVPNLTPLGSDAPMRVGGTSFNGWFRYWWGEEAVKLIDSLIEDDRDFREILTGRQTFVNGPLAQFYRVVAPQSCCGSGPDFKYTQPDPLFRPSALPADLPPYATDTWRRVDDRGPYAAGILTMPAFLTKYGSRRGRAHVLYNAFLCKDFVAGNVALTPSNEANLMVRPGCNTCHVTLEPLAAHFTRVLENDWTYLPKSQFPTLKKECAAADPKKTPGFCRPYYDPLFTNTSNGMLRGAYGSVEAADGGPAGLAETITKGDVFPTCVAQNVASSFLGRALTPDDAAFQKQLSETFVAGGFKMRALVRAVVRADAYRGANNLTSSDWREGGAK